MRLLAELLAAPFLLLAWAALACGNLILRLGE